MFGRQVLHVTGDLQQGAFTMVEDNLATSPQCLGKTALNFQLRRDSAQLSGPIDGGWYSGKCGFGGSYYELRGAMVGRQFGDEANGTFDGTIRNVGAVASFAGFCPAKDHVWQLRRASPKTAL
jgi:hypothetical protein